MEQFHDHFSRNPVTLQVNNCKSETRHLTFLLRQPISLKKTLADFDGKKKVLSVVLLSILVSAQRKHVDSTKNQLTLDNTVVLTVSMDPPFAQGRWCGAEGLDNAIMLSDYFDHSFGHDYALLINEWHLLARAVFVLDTDNVIRYVEYVDNINTEPDFEAAIVQLKNQTKITSIMTESQRNLAFFGILDGENEQEETNDSK